MSVEPGIVYLLLIDFSDRKIGLCILTVQIISIYVSIIKLIVLPDALSLIIEFLYRLVVVNSYVSDRLVVVCYRASIKVI